MKLSNLLKVRSSDNPVTAAWTHYRQSVWEAEAGQHYADGKYHPSMLGKCPAWLFLMFAGFDLPHEDFNDRTARIFDNGDGVHERIQVQLARAGVLETQGLDDSMETPIDCPEFNIGGHCDGVLNFGPKRDTGQTIIMFGKECPVYEFLDKNQRSVLEIKSINQRGFNEVSKKGPKPEHIWQANIYAKILDIKKVSFIYECKDDQRWLEFTSPASEKSWKEVEQVVRTVDKWVSEFKKTGLIPKGVYDAAKLSAKNRKPWDKVIAQDFLRPPMGQEHLFKLVLKADSKKPVAKKPKSVNKLLKSKGKRRATT